MISHLCTTSRTSRPVIPKAHLLIYVHNWCAYPQDFRQLLLGGTLGVCCRRQRHTLCGQAGRPCLRQHCLFLQQCHPGLQRAEWEHRGRSVHTAAVSRRQHRLRSHRRRFEPHDPVLRGWQFPSMFTDNTNHDPNHDHERHNVCYYHRDHDDHSDHLPDHLHKWFNDCYDQCNNQHNDD